MVTVMPRSCRSRVRRQLAAKSRRHARSVAVIRHQAKSNDSSSRSWSARVDPLASFNTLIGSPPIRHSRHRAQAQDLPAQAWNRRCESSHALRVVPSRAHPPVASAASGLTFPIGHGPGDPPPRPRGSLASGNAQSRSPVASTMPSSNHFHNSRCNMIKYQR
jgi:hypothetical protein